MRITVTSPTLAGLAAAARLAKLGHDVTLTTGGRPLGGRFAPHPGPDGELVDALPQTYLLPAPWRDLFRKSGRAFDAELGRAGLDLVDAPAATHRFADGLEFALPAERGQQFATLSHHLGRSAAERWRDLLDDLDDTWLALRRHGVESPTPIATASKDERTRLLQRHTLANLADRLTEPHLAAIVLSQGWRAGTDSHRAPALCASRLVVERTFGRWQLRDDTGPVRASRLIDLLVDRLATRRVRVVEYAPDEPDARVHTEPHLQPARWPRRSPRPALAPRTTHTLTDASGADVTELVDHAARTVTWQRPLPGGGAMASTHDFSAPTPDLAWGLAPDDWTAWMRRTPITGDGSWRASACSPAGNEPWAELASAALAVYETHEHLTGEDARPTNKARR